MGCDDALPLIEKLVDGEADVHERHQIEAHLESCAVCRDHRRFLEALPAAAEESAPKAPPDLYWQVLPRKIMTRIEKDRSGRESPGWLTWMLRPARARWLGLVAAAILVVVAGREVLDVGIDRGVPPTADFGAGKADLDPAPERGDDKRRPEAQSIESQALPEPGQPRPNEPTAGSGRLRQSKKAPRSDVEGGRPELRARRPSASIEPSAPGPPEPEEPKEPKEPKEPEEEQPRQQVGAYRDEALPKGVRLDELDAPVRSGGEADESGSKDRELALGRPSAEKLEERSSASSGRESAVRSTDSEAALRRYEVLKKWAETDRVTSDNCAGWREFLEQFPDNVQAREARYQLARCAIRLFEREESEDHRRQALEEGARFLELVPAGERADEIRSALRGIRER